LVTAN